MSRRAMIVLAILAAATAALCWLRGWQRARAHPDELGQVVVRVFERAWAQRLGRTPAELNAALFSGADEALRRRVDRDVGVVDLRFDRSGARGAVTTTITVNYPVDEQRSTAQLTLPWDDVPQAVRAELLRGGTTVFRQWRALT